MKKNIEISPKLQGDIEEFQHNFHQPTFSAAILTLIRFGLHHYQKTYPKEFPFTYPTVSQEPNQDTADDKKHKTW